MKGVGRERTGYVRLESGQFEILLVSLISICVELQTARLSLRVGPGYLLHDGDEEADLHLSRKL